LHAKYGNADWIHQAVDAISLAAARAIENLSGLSVSENVQPLSNGSAYAYPARSKQELLDTKHLVPEAVDIGDAPEPPPEPKVERQRTKKKVGDEWLL
jgi:hypothetical protein